MIDDTNSIVNYNRYHILQLNATIRTLSPEQKQRLLEEIQLQKGVHNLLERDYNREDCERVEKALKKGTKC